MSVIHSKEVGNHKLVFNLINDGIDVENLVGVFKDGQNKQIGEPIPFNILLGRLDGLIKRVQKFQGGNIYYLMPHDLKDTEHSIEHHVLQMDCYTKKIHLSWAGFNYIGLILLTKYIPNTFEKSR